MVIFHPTKWFNRLKISAFTYQILITFGTRLIVLAVSFALSIITARYLGPEGRGIYTVLTTVAAMGVQFGNFGLHSANTFFVSKRKNFVPDIIANTMWLSLAGGSFVALIVLLIMRSNQAFACSIPFSLSVVAVFSIPFGLLFMLGQSIFLGLREIKVYNFFDLISNSTTFFVIALLLVGFSQGVGAIITTTTVFSFIFSLTILLRLRGRMKNFSFDRLLFTQMFYYGLRAYLACLFAFLVVRFDIFLANHYLGTEAAGVYSIAVSVANFLYILPAAVGTILFPKILSMSEGTWEFTKKIALATAGIMFIICLAAWLLARPFIVSFYGEPFAQASAALLYLLPGIYFFSIMNIFANFLASVGYPGYVAVIWAAAFVINVLLNMYYIPLLGINGAALTSTIVYTLVFVLNLWGCVYESKKEFRKAV
ncbi:MAG: hypothetical protein C4589_06205 [Peptococcaceae bacterium]|nr:MAG: hypothetical protein C4589_06205 [Peptococcaceae bacterium]